jgi:DNA-binding protein HU-beta
MRKQDLIDTLAAHHKDLTKKQVSQLVEDTFQTIRNSLAQGQKVTITGFGSFEVVNRNEREGRNPRTGKKITIAARKAPQFRAGSELKRAVGGE